MVACWVSMIRVNVLIDQAVARNKPTKPGSLLCLALMVPYSYETGRTTSLDRRKSVTPSQVSLSCSTSTMPASSPAMSIRLRQPKLPSTAITALSALWWFWYLPSSQVYSNQAMVLAPGLETRKVQPPDRTLDVSDCHTLRSLAAKSVRLGVNSRAR